MIEIPSWKISETRGRALPAHLYNLYYGCQIRNRVAPFDKLPYQEQEIWVRFAALITDMVWEYAAQEVIRKLSESQSTGRIVLEWGLV